jgi:glutaredoxin
MRLSRSNHRTVYFVPVSIFVLENRRRTALESRRMIQPRSVVVYSRKGCHLCEVVKESLTKLSRRGGFTWQEVDVDADTELRRQYNDEVPVVFIDGHKAFKYRMNEQEFLRKLAS